MIAPIVRAMPDPIAVDPAGATRRLEALRADLEGVRRSLGAAHRDRDMAAREIGRLLAERDGLAEAIGALAAALNAAAVARAGAMIEAGEDPGRAGALVESVARVVGPAPPPPRRHAAVLLLYLGEERRARVEVDADRVEAALAAVEAFGAPAPSKPTNNHT